MSIRVQFERMNGVIFRRAIARNSLSSIRLLLDVSMSTICLLVNVNVNVQIGSQHCAFGGLATVVFSLYANQFIFCNYVILR